MKEYSPQKIEKKWQKFWEKKGIYEASDTSDKPKFYGLFEFPYPSGDGLHVGHLRPYIGMDVVVRKRRMQGHNVLFPVGWDAFGLPTENYAIKTGVAPQIATKKNTDTFRRQMKSVGPSLDWTREINTTDPTYYKWTQWIFLQLYKQGLAYKKKMVINWCPKDKIGLANEEVVNGCCERCGTQVEKREKEQWMLAITKYADRLDKDLDTVDYLEKIKIQQRNWIGKSEGVEIKFLLKSKTADPKQGLGGVWPAEGQLSETVTVFTTRPDTLYGVTYVVLAPEHSFVNILLEQCSNKSEVISYIQKAKKKSDIERTDAKKEKTGVELKGVRAINPVNEEEVPVWIADYVLADYGTGAVMAVPAHDERDYEFAKKYNLPVKEAPEASQDVISKVGTKVVKYKLRDWIFSRQRYWGEPIPMVNCKKCGWVPVPEKDLPVKLPNVKNYIPTDTGESPLASVTKWVNTKCPQCKGPAKRETDTMPNWAGSSWYYLRYTDPKNKKAFASPEKMKYWLTPRGIDWYNGGMEHTTLHLLYSRFWHKFLYNQKLVPTSEPYAKRTSHGLILAEGGEKMSKSKGNVVNPDSIVENYGADTLRLYEMFMGPFDQAVAWSTDGIVGPRRFLEKVWRFQEKLVKKAPFDARLETVIHKTIKKISDDIEAMQFNTAVSSLMILANEMEKKETLAESYYKHLLQLLAPFAPHIAEELWAKLGNKISIHLEKWPTYNPSKIVETAVTIAIQINGKVRADMKISSGLDEVAIRERALAHPDIASRLVGKKVGKVIYVKGRVINIVALD